MKMPQEITDSAKVRIILIDNLQKKFSNIFCTYVDVSKLPQNPSVVKLITNAISWMTEGKTAPKVAANLDFLDKQFGIAFNSVGEALDDSDLDVFILASSPEWPEDLVERLRQFMENGGSLIVSSDIDSSVNV